MSEKANYLIIAGQEPASSTPNAKNPEPNKKEECNEDKTDIQRNLGSGNGGQYGSLGVGSGDANGATRRATAERFEAIH
jgi:hypothetical protein